MQHRKKIIFLSKFYNPHVGGVEKHVKKITEFLMRKNFDVIIITEGYDKSLPLEERKGKETIYRIPVGKNNYLKKFFIWFWVFKNLKLFKDTDIIHVHDVFYWILPFRFFLNGKKIFTTFHGYEGYPFKLKWRVLRKIYEVLSNGNICVGDFMKKWYYTSPTFVIYGGVNKITKTITPQSQTAVFFGRLDEQTGILEYVKAYEIIKKKYPHFKLTVVGDGQLRKEISRSVDILPFDINIEKHISQNRFIFVSRYLSMLEALVQGREVIAVYDNPIKKDYLYLSPFRKYVQIAKNSREIAKIVTQSLNKPMLIQNKIEKGKNWAKTNSWEKVAGIYIKLWDIGK